MPKLVKILGPLEVSRLKLKGNGQYAVGGPAGLMLKVDGGSQSWVLRTMISGKRHSMGLGAYPGLDLADARRKAQEARDTIRSGGDPLRARSAAKAAAKAQLRPKPAKVKKLTQYRALTWREIPVFMRDLSVREGVAARALEWAILTAARSGEVRGMVWGELDLRGRTWTVPAERMKADKMHRVPLTDAASALLGEPGEPRDLVFPAPHGGQLSDMAMLAVLRRMKRADCTVHGFRSSFRDWAGEATHHPREVIEHALAHQLKDKAEAAYARGDLLKKRTALMKDWSEFCRMLDEPPRSPNAMGITGRVVKRLGRPITWAKKDDARFIYERLRALGASALEAQSFVRSAMGVLFSEILCSSEKGVDPAVPDAILSDTALAKWAHLIRLNMHNSITFAKRDYYDLPTAAQDWLKRGKAAP